MLKLTNLVKDYKGGGDVGTVHALKGINIAFRENEFVAILGPSGCGKTTLLNIVGGLDHATDGDLSIDGISTKDYKDSDWDNYRNHRVGFVFQSYNLIPHQTILQNVELALAIGGLSKEERIAKAKTALDEVGLEGQYNKKPNQLSGGQCQRVAIARAIVSDPEILLADEPTGALDTETSLQIMDIIQEISKNRLVIMVTHNPDLAEKYATRIVRLLDGNIVSDSAPYEEIIEEDKKDNAPEKQAKLSLSNAFRLSAQNLKSKSRRTALVAIAASIGIIGVSAVLAISSGVRGYMGDMEADMLSGNPLSIEETALDLNSLMSITGSLAQSSAVMEGSKDGYINVTETITALVNSEGEVKQFMFSNNITPEYMDYVEQMNDEFYNAIVFDYGLDISTNIYLDSQLEGAPYGTSLASIATIRQVYQSILGETEFEEYSQFVQMIPQPFQLLPNSDELILSQYDIVSNPETSHLPHSANEIVLVISDNALSDLVLAQTGLMSQESFLNNVYEVIGDEHYDPDLEEKYLSYDEVMAKSYYYVPSQNLYQNREAQGQSVWMYDSAISLEDEFVAEPLELKVTAILQKKSNIHYGCLSSGFYYTNALADQFRKDAAETEIIQYLQDNNLKGFTSTNPLISTYSYSFQGTSHPINFWALTSTSSSMLSSFMGSSDPVLFPLYALGGGSMPRSIDIYPKDVNQMDNIRAYLNAWNGEEDILVGDKVLTAEDRPEIRYTDTLSVVLGMVNSMVDLITIALVAFTALSLVVSTVMIAVITYVSVIERIKEIGVIRSLGGRKKDVSRLFNAETIIIGLIAGLIGIAITYIIQLILNLIVGGLTGVYTIAALPWWQALIMVLLSMTLTLISGLIPASLAAKKDPVEALRSE